jgi:hypothetical protein
MANASYRRFAVCLVCVEFETMAKLTFVLPDEEGELPVRTESIHCDCLDGRYKICNIPFFVRDLAFGDVIEVLEKTNDEVVGWRHTMRSCNSTIWVKILGSCDFSSTSKLLRDLGCDVEGFPALDLFAISVPLPVDAATIDQCLSRFTDKEIAVAYPAWRHSEDDVL